MQLSSTGALAGLLGEDVKLKLGIKRVRGDTFGYLQRALSAACPTSISANRERRAKRWCSLRCVALAVVAGKTRVMEDEFIAPGGTDVTDALRIYLRPLLGSGMPDAFRLRDHPVAKVLRGGG